MNYDQPGQSVLESPEEENKKLESPQEADKIKNYDAAMDKAKTRGATEFRTAFFKVDRNSTSSYDEHLEKGEEVVYDWVDEDNMKDADLGERAADIKYVLVAKFPEGK